MQLYNEVKNILSELESYSLNINNKFKSEEINYSPEEINILYFERGKIVEDILECKKSDEWTIFLNSNKDFFSEYIEKIQKIENENIKLINEQISNISDNIKNLMKQKSLLIYMKT